MVDLVQIGRIFSAGARVRIVEELLSRPLTAEALAEKLSLKSITVHHHLRVLARAGLIDEIGPKRTGKSGRPRTLFRLSSNTTSLQFPPRQYQMLADLLMGVLSETLPKAELRERSRAIARANGRKLAEALVQRSGLARWKLSDLRKCFVEDHASEMGFAPEVIEETKSSLRYGLHNCLYLEMAKKHPDFLCEMDRPLLQTLLQKVGLQADAQQVSCMGRGATHCEYLVQLTPSARSNGNGKAAKKPRRK